MTRNFGKYAVPLTLQALRDMFDDEEALYNALHFYVSLDDFRYLNTPSDVIVFGHIGMDGIHYGFLTDFGMQADLEQAPIVCVCPMDFQQPVRLVAHQLQHFLQLCATDDALFYNHFAHETDYAAFQRTQPTHALPPALEQLLHSEPIANPYAYVQSVRSERTKQISIATLDGLGVRTPLLAHETHKPLPLHPAPTIEAFTAYIQSAPLASRYALLRDMQFHHLLHEQSAFKATVLAAMQQMGLVDEAHRLA